MIPLNPLKYGNLKEFSKDYDRALRNIFKDEIKGNFLIKIFHKVLDIMGSEINNYYPENNSMEDSIIRSSDVFQYDICKMIVGLHKSNTIFVSDKERLKMQESVEYQNQLMLEVVENIKLRQYGSLFFRNKQIMYGDRFLYFDLPYNLFVICTRMNYLLVENQDSQIPFFNHLSKISTIGLSALSLLEDNFLDNAYPLCRMILELYIEMMALLKNPKVQNCYATYSKIEFEKTQAGKEYPQDFIEQFENRINKNESKITMFLHFGWVDKIRNYHNIVKKNPYSISGIIEYLKKQDREQDWEAYERLYKMCHSYSHANIIGVRYPLLQYFEISIMLSMAIMNSYLMLCQFLDIDKRINGIDIESKTIKSYNKAVSQYDMKSTQNFEDYYKSKLDFLI